MARGNICRHTLSSTVSNANTTITEDPIDPSAFAIDGFSDSLLDGDDLPDSLLDGDGMPHEIEMVPLVLA
jgi:hypothetical protein